MTKNGNKLGWIKLGVTIAVLMGGGLIAWANLGTEAALQAEAIEGQTEATVTLKVEGCKPAQRNKFDVALVQKDIQTIQSTQSTIQADVKDLRKEQREGFRAILERLPEK
jgi:hypothetical protein